MERATPVQMRKSLEVVEVFKKAGLRFVPIPVIDEADFLAQTAELNKRLETIEQMCD